MNEVADTLTSRVVTQCVDCDWRRAYALAADPLRLADWASGLSKSTLAPIGDHWMIETPQGLSRLRFAPDNAFGVLDHWVTPEGMPEIYLPFRVIEAGAGACEFEFTLFRQPHMDDAAFERDAGWIVRDLQTLKRLLETG